MKKGDKVTVHMANNANFGKVNFDAVLVCNASEEDNSYVVDADIYVGDMLVHRRLTINGSSTSFVGISEVIE